jgi:hypothetical protein
MLRSFLIILAILLAFLLLLLLTPLAERVGITLYLWKSSYYQKVWEALDYQYDVSPLGKKIVFAGEGEGGRDLYVLEISPRRIRRLTYSTGFEHEVRFLDEHILVASVLEEPRNPLSPLHLYLIDTRDGSSRRLTQGKSVYNQNPFPLSSHEVLFRRMDIEYTMKPWGMEVDGTNPQWYIMDTHSGNTLLLHTQNFYFDYAFLNAVWSDRRRLLETSIIGDRNDLFLRYLSSPLGTSSSVRSERMVRLARNGRDGVLSADEKCIYYLSDNRATAVSDIMRLDLASRRVIKLLSRGRFVTSLRIRGAWLFFLEGSGTDVTLWRVDTQGKRLEKLLTPSQFANPLGK